MRIRVCSVMVVTTEHGPSHNSEECFGMLLRCLAVTQTECVGGSPALLHVPLVIQRDVIQVAANGGRHAGRRRVDSWDLNCSPDALCQTLSLGVCLLHSLL